MLLHSRPRPGLHGTVPSIILFDVPDRVSGLGDSHPQDLADLIGQRRIKLQKRERVARLTQELDGSRSLIHLFLAQLLLLAKLAEVVDLGLQILFTPLENLNEHVGDRFLPLFRTLTDGVLQGSHANRRGAGRNNRIHNVIERFGIGHDFSLVLVELLYYTTNRRFVKCFTKNDC